MIVEKLKVSLLEVGHKKLIKEKTNNEEAYDTYLKGLVLNFQKAYQKAKSVVFIHPLGILLPTDE